MCFQTCCFFSPQTGFLCFLLNASDVENSVSLSLGFSQSISRYSSFGFAEFCAFWQYRDPCYFSCHLSGFRGFLSILGCISFFGFHQMFVMQEIQLAETVGFFVCSEICCFSFIHRVLLIPQYVQNGQKVSWPIYETFCCVFRFLVILNSCYNVISVLLRLLLFFTPFIEFSVCFVDFSD